MPQQAPAPHAAFEAQLRALEQRLTNLETLIRLLPSFTDSGWVAVGFENSWKNTGGAFFAAAFRKEGNVIRLRAGRIEGGLSGKSALHVARKGSTGREQARTPMPAGRRKRSGRSSRGSERFGYGRPVFLTAASDGDSTIGLDGVALLRRTLGELCGDRNLRD